MTEGGLVEALERPDAYPGPVHRVESLETHISHLFFAGDRVYKVKKAIDLGFLDYGTLERRCHFCEEEVRLNRRLAPDVYLGVVPVTRSNGRLRVGAEGDVVEWAVKMVRLPADRMLSEMLDRGRIGHAEVAALARLLAGFHAGAATGEGVDQYGSHAAVSEKVLDNLDEVRAFAGDPAAGEGKFLSERLFAFLDARTRKRLEDGRDSFDRRVARGRVREGHGDLHCGNVCYLENDIIAYDCIEFSKLLRCGDVASDLAFLAMDLDHRGRPQLSDGLVARYAELTDDGDLPDIVDFYKVYRALVRAKVAALPAGGTDEAEARRYLHLAAGYELPPCVLLTCGLPGTGKSWAARRLARPLRAELLRSDVVRKKLAGLAPEQSARDEYGEGLYSNRMTERTYLRLLELTRRAVAGGRSVVVDAGFGRRALRGPFLEAAEEADVPVRVVWVDAAEELVRERMATREENPSEASDADLSVHRRARATFEPPDEVGAARLVEHRSGRDGDEQLVGAVLERLLPR